MTLYRLFVLVIGCTLLAACGATPAAVEPSAAPSSAAPATVEPSTAAASVAASSQPSAAPSAAAEASAAAGDSRTITDASGAEVEVPTTPQRVVALTEHDLDSVLALGITPIGVRDWYGSGYETACWRWSEAAIGDGQPEFVGTFGTSNC